MSWHGASLILPQIGFLELLVIVLILLLIFGGKKLPELARGLGEAIREFRRASSEQPAETARQAARSQEAKEALFETARKLGISTEGKTLEEISEEIVKAARKSKE